MYYRMSEGIHICQLSGSYIALDVGADEYIKFTAKQSALLNEILLRGVPRSQLSDDALKFAGRLVSKNMIAVTPTASSSDIGSPIRPSTNSIFPSFADRSPKIAFKHAPRFAQASIMSWFVLKYLSFAQVVSVARNWKRNVDCKCRRPLEEVSELVSEFHQLTPLFFTTRDACKYRSLTLLRYLSFFDVPANWVFGVRLAAFGAHCWIEFEGVILNEHLESASQFKPIMSI